MNEINNNKYVQQEVFDSHIQRIYQRFEAADKLLAERLDKMQALMQALMEKNQAVMEAKFEELRGDVKAMSSRLDTIQQQYSWKIGWLGTLFTFGGAALAVYPLLSKYLTQEWIMAGFGIGGLLILLFSLARR